MATIFLTGATSGIGRAAALELASRGHSIIASARTAAKGEELASHFLKECPNAKGSIETVVCDLSDFASIVQACKEIRGRVDALDMLINNAGIWNFSYRQSKNGIEEILHVNVLAPLLINHLLVDMLVASKEAKSIFASSGLHQGDVQFSDLEFKSNFSGFKAYRQSKLMLILVTRLLAKRLASKGVGVYCEHPGLVDTQLSRDAGWFSSLFFRVMGTRPEKGAETIVFLAEENKDKLVSGEYYHNKVVTKTTSQSYDLAVADKLMVACQAYLKDYLGAPSLIFP